MYRQLIAVLLLALIALSGCMQVAPTVPSTPAESTQPAQEADPTPDAEVETPEPVEITGPYQPLAAEECEEIRAAVADMLGVEATLAETTFIDYITGQEGTGCQITVTGTGEDFTHFIDVATQLEAMLIERGWSQDMDYVADGPTGTAMGLRMDNKLALLNVGWEPSEDADCPADMVITECELTPEQQLYTITVSLAENVEEPVASRGEVGDRDLSPEAENAAMIVRQALMQQLHANLDTVEIVSVEPMEWPGGCLGLPAENEVCTMAIVPGYRVTLAANGETYVYRTDADAMNIRVEEAPAPQIGETMIEWTSNEEDGVCTTAQIGTEGVAWGLCGNVLMQGYLTPDRQDDLAEFASTYAPFEAETTAGTVVFQGTGNQEATDTEQRMIAEWAQLVQLEASAGRSGASWGLAFAWHREGGIAGFCDDLTVYVTGQVFASTCAGNTPETLADTRLSADHLAQLYEWIDTLQSFEYEQTDPAVADAMTIRLTFSGAGDQQPTEAQQQEILDFAAQLYTELTQ